MKQRTSTVIKWFCVILAVLGTSFGFSKSSPALAVQETQTFSLNDSPSLTVWADFAEEGSQRQAISPQLINQTAGIQQSVIQITYNGAWDPKARSAVEYGKIIWEQYLFSPVPIEVVAAWEDAGDELILGTARAGGYFRDFPSHGAIEPNTWYPSALANKLAGFDLDPMNPDIYAVFNRAFFSGEGWYFGADENVGPNQWDLTSVVMHELAHGLGFVGSMDVGSTYCGGGENGCWGGTSGYPFIFDRFAVDTGGSNLVNPDVYPNYSPLLGSVLRSGSIFFNGRGAIRAYGGLLPPLYAPNTWNRGSSFSHLDEALFPAGSTDSLMTPFLENGEAVRAVGGITLGILDDLGWSVGQTGSLSHPVYLPFLTK